MIIPGLLHGSLCCVCLCIYLYYIEMVHVYRYGNDDNFPVRIPRREIFILIARPNKLILNWMNINMDESIPVVCIYIYMVAIIVQVHMRIHYNQLNQFAIENTENWNYTLIWIARKGTICTHIFVVNGKLSSMKYMNHWFNTTTSNMVHWKYIFLLYIWTAQSRPHSKRTKILNRRKKWYFHAVLAIKRFTIDHWFVFIAFFFYVLFLKIVQTFMLYLLCMLYGQPRFP